MMPVPMHDAASELPTDGDGLDLLVMPSPTPVQAAGPEPAGPKMSQRVLDLISRGTLQRSAVLTLQATFTPSTPSPMTQARHGPVAEAIARIAAVSAERCEVTRRSDQAERDRCAATARLLASAGWWRATEQKQSWQLLPTPCTTPHHPHPHRMWWYHCAQYQIVL